MVLKFKKFPNLSSWYFKLDSLIRFENLSIDGLIESHPT